jgi:hypothetical protein
VIVLLVLGHPGKSTPSSAGTGKVLAPISASAPPSDPAAGAPCTALLSDLPVAIPTSNGTLGGRVVHSSSTFITAWGNPAIVLRCGVPRPAGLTVNSGAFVVGIEGVNFFESKTGAEFVYTAIDRAAYIEVSVPKAYAQPPLGPIADAIAKALPQVCLTEQTGQPAPDPAKLCTHRK